LPELYTFRCWDDEFDLGGAINFTPNGELATDKGRSFLHTGQAVVARTSADNIGAYAFSVVANA